MSRTKSSSSRRSDLPGIDEKSLQVKVEDGTLTLIGEHKLEEETGGMIGDALARATCIN